MRMLSNWKALCRRCLMQSQRDFAISAGLRMQQPENMLKNKICMWSALVTYGTGCSHAQECSQSSHSYNPFLQCYRPGEHICRIRSHPPQALCPFRPLPMPASDPLVCCLLIRRQIGADRSRNTAAMHQCAWPYRSARLANQGIVPEASHCGGLAAEPYVSPKCLRQCQSVELKFRQDSPYSNQDQSNPTATPRMSSCNVWFIVLFTRHLAGPQAVFLSNCQHKLQHSIIPINQYMVHRSVFPPSRRPSSCLPIQLPTQAAAQYHSHQPI